MLYDLKSTLTNMRHKFALNKNNIKNDYAIIVYNYILFLDLEIILTYDKMS